MGFFDRRIVTPPKKDDLVYSLTGWDNDLVTVDAALDLFEFEHVAGTVTEGQARAALSVDAGGLVIDTDAAEAAGASADAEWRYHFKDLFSANTQFVTDIEVLAGASSSDTLRVNFILLLEDVAGAPLIPGGASSSALAFRKGTSGYGLLQIWGDTKTATTLTAATTAKMTSSIYDWDQPVGTMFKASDNTFATVSSSFVCTNPRSVYATPLPADASINPYFEVRRPGGTTGRIYMKIHRLHLAGKVL